MAMTPDEPVDDDRFAPPATPAQPAPDIGADIAKAARSAGLKGRTPLSPPLPADLSREHEAAARIMEAGNQR
jgi:hypothetical protein